VPDRTGRLLRVDLSSSRLSREPIPDNVLRQFIGGRGLGIKYLFDELRPRVDPLGPDNKLLLLSGPLAGTSAQSCSRWVAMTKSPLTGGITRAVGGADFGAWIRLAGLDFILVEGSSETPVYVHIDGDSAKVLPADDLWGLDTVKTEQLLKQRHGSDSRSACIGPGGERLVRYATITSSRRTASRGGVGTVMGSKKLKGVVISRSHHTQVPVLKSVAKRQVEVLQSGRTPAILNKYGTTFLTPGTQEMGMLPVRNFQVGRLEGLEKLGPEAFLTLKKGNFGCYSCMIKCGNIHEISEGAFKGVRSEGPEYETIWAFGPNIANTDASSIVAAEIQCDLFGIDTISAGNSIGFAYELYQRGILTRKETNSLELIWGDYRPMLQLVQLIIEQRGLGRILGEGVRRAASIFGQGADDYAMHVKGQEFPGYDPRGAKAEALSYATSNIGASHMYGRNPQELHGDPYPRPLDRFADENKGDIVAFNQKMTAFRECGVMCAMIFRSVLIPLMGELFAKATGYEELLDQRQIELIGERVLTLERAFNVREGFSRDDDTLPKRMRTEPLQDAGPATGQYVRNLDTLLDEYYQAMGYSSRGIPLSETLSKLGLGRL